MYGLAAAGFVALMGALLFATAFVPTVAVVYTAAPEQVYAAEVEDVATTSPEAEALAKYLRSKGADELAEYSAQIIELPRWKEALAIAGKETSFCLAGVGSSSNNCGAIMSPRPDRKWKIYDNVYDAVWDISFLLQKPRYKDLTIKQMNGIYCVDESQEGNRCPQWDAHIEHFMAEIDTALES